MTTYTIMRTRVITEYFVVEEESREGLQAKIDRGYYFKGLRATVKDDDLHNLKIFEGDAFDLKRKSEEVAPTVHP